MGERRVRFKGIYVVVLNVFVIKIFKGVKKLNQLTIKDSQEIMVNVLVDEYYGRLSWAGQNKIR